MIDEALILSAFLLGFFGGVHCLGMCGGISTALTVSLATDQKQHAKYLLCCYHVGRITCYILLGILFSLLGFSIKKLIGPIGSIGLHFIASLFVIGVGLSFFGCFKSLALLERGGLSVWQKISPLGRHLLPIDRPIKAVVMGAIWGLIPCGMVYTAIALSMTAHNIENIFLVMLAFSIGTMPMMLAISFSTNKINRHVSTHWQRYIAGISLVLLGTTSIIRLL